MRTIHGSPCSVIYALSCSYAVCKCDGLWNSHSGFCRWCSGARIFCAIFVPYDGQQEKKMAYLAKMVISARRWVLIIFLDFWSEWWLCIWTSKYIATGQDIPVVSGSPCRLYHAIFPWTASGLICLCLSRITVPGFHLDTSTRTAINAQHVACQSNWFDNISRIISSVFVISGVGVLQDGTLGEKKWTAAWGRRSRKSIITNHLSK